MTAFVARDGSRRPVQERAGMTTTDVPSYTADLYSDEAIADPYPHYRALRDLGPVVWLGAQQVYAVPRYDEARAVLLDDGTYLSSGAIALNDVINEAMRGGTIASDGELHAHLRQVVAHRLTPRALRPLRGYVQEQADALVADLVRRRSFDAVSDLAQALPLAIVPEFVGLPVRGRAKLLDWASANFDSLGPMNERCAAALPGAVEMGEYAAKTVADGDVRAGSLADGVIQAAHRGEISGQQSVRLMLAYVAPSLDTTISAVASAVWLFANNDDQWQKLRQDPSLIPGAVNEIVRCETPIRALGRRAGENTTLAGTDLKAGDQLLVIYASANRDERQWDSPDVFDVTRDATRSLGFGYGVHGCAGQGLARIEIEGLLKSLVRNVRRFVVTEKPQRVVNNVIRAFASLPVRIEADGA
jgi:cytochrome P450